MFSLAIQHFLQPYLHIFVWQSSLPKRYLYPKPPNLIKPFNNPHLLISDYSEAFKLKFREISTLLIKKNYCVQPLKNKGFFVLQLSCNIAFQYQVTIFQGFLLQNLGTDFAFGRLNSTWARYKSPDSTPKNSSYI